jgi:hypothetical protein
VSNPQSQMYRLLSTSAALPCGYVMGVHGASASGIPGLKSETWGTLRVFPLALVGRENSHTGLSPYPSSTDALLFLELLASELRIACVHQRGVNDRAQNCFRLIPLASNSLQLLGCLTAPPFHPQRLLFAHHCIFGGSRSTSSKYDPLIAISALVSSARI